MFEAGTQVQTNGAKASKLPDGAVRVVAGAPSRRIAITADGTTQRRAAIVLLNESDSLQFYCQKLAGIERAILTPAQPLVDNDKLRLKSDWPEDFIVSVFPPVERLSVNGRQVKANQDGIFPGTG